MIENGFNHVIFNGKNLLDFNCKVSGDGIFSSSYWDDEEASIPGRDGSLVIPKHRVTDLLLPYRGSIGGAKTLEMVDSLRDFLLQDSSYHKLEDTYHPESFYMARFKGPIDPKFVNHNLDGCTFDLNFYAIPRRYLKIGEQKFTINSSSTSVILNNPTYNNAKPLVAVTGNGVIRFNGNLTITVANNSGTIFIDCDTENAYNSSKQNMNNKITLLDNTFPYLIPGQNVIAITSGSPTVVVTPRWYKR